jgi:thiamine pyrophosphate-dependent acetolactate synthase large subunit-like protein
MTLGELETARRAGIGLTIVVVNNSASGYVKALQYAMFRGRYQSSDLVEMNYAAIAARWGATASASRTPTNFRQPSPPASPSAPARPSSTSS